MSWSNNEQQSASIATLNETRIESQYSGVVVPSISMILIDLIIP